MPNAFRRHPRLGPESRGTALRSCGTALLFLLAAAGGEWIVHQVQYLIEYGSQFGAVMAASPHRLYMAPLGSVLALAVLLGLALTVLTLRVRAVRRRLLLQRLPGRLHSAAGIEQPGIRTRQVVRLAAALFACQVAIYFTQENLETVARGLSFPGLTVLLAPGHWTVLPLHALLALTDGLLLAVIAAWLAGSRRALRVVEALVRLIARGRQTLPIVAAPAVSLPCLRLDAGRLGLRSPPLR